MVEGTGSSAIPRIVRRTILSGPCPRQTGHNGDIPKGRDGADPVAHGLDQFVSDLDLGAIDTRLEDDEATGHLAFHGVGGAMTAHSATWSLRPSSSFA